MTNPSMQKYIRHITVTNKYVTYRLSPSIPKVLHFTSVGYRLIVLKTPSSKSTLNAFGIPYVNSRNLIFILTYTVITPWLPCFPYPIIDTHFPCIQYYYLFEFKDSHITISDLNHITPITLLMSFTKLICTLWAYIESSKIKVDVYNELFELLNQDC